LKWYKETLHITTNGKGLYSFTQDANTIIRRWGIPEGMCYLFIQHTSASLVISESYDPTARLDIETSLEKLIPENQPWMQHTIEGGDDSSSHIRSILTPSSLTIPVENALLCLGTWQGVYVFEHRHRPHQRNILMRCLSVE
jgi:secondary thiamine-phosphate synthase enzyme